VSNFEDFDDTPMPVEGRPLPEKQSGWAKTLAWAILILGGVYLLNPTWGMDVLPDNLPLIGNLDEAAVMLLMLGALRSLGIYLPEFIERRIQPTSRLPPPSDRE
jgi:hypothetical protein